jgi:Bacterial Ig-like domain (group 3)
MVAGEPGGPRREDRGRWIFGDRRFTLLLAFHKNQSMLRRTVGPIVASSLSAGLRSAAFGQSINLTATVKNVSALSAPVDGSVPFLDHDSVLGIGELRGGRATITTRDAPVGQNAIEAVYGGSEIFAPSASDVMIVSIGIMPTDPVRPRAAVGREGSSGRLSPRDPG